MPIVRKASFEAGTRTQNRVALLGQTTVTSAGEAVRLRSRELDVFAALALARGQPVSVDRLTTLLWSAEPATAAMSIRNHVSRVRHSLGQEAITTDGGSYRLGAAFSVDLDDFDANRIDGERAARDSDHELALASFSLALDLVRGVPLSSFPDTGQVLSERHRLDEQIDTAREGRLVALLETGRNAAAAEAATDWITVGTDRERIWAVAALATARTGDRRGALVLLQHCRRHLREDAGLGVSHATHRLEALILADDPTVSTAAVAELIDSGRRIDSFTRAGEQFYVGRADEMASTLAAIDRIRHRVNAGIVHVIGPPASGRSAFARRLAILTRGEGWLAALATCRALTLRPFEPFGEVLDDITRKVTMSADLDPVLQRLALLGQNMVADTPRAEWLPDDIVALIAAIAAQQRVVIVIDDADRLPRTTSRVLQRLTTLAVPIAVVLIGREPLAPASGDEPIRFAPLAPDEVTQLFRALTGSDLNPEQAKQLMRATGGNPVLVRAGAMDTPQDFGDPGHGGEDGHAGGQHDQHLWTSRLHNTATSAVTRLDHDALLACAALVVRPGESRRDELGHVLTKVGLATPSIAVGDLVARGLVHAPDDLTWSVASSEVREATVARCADSLLLDLHRAWMDVLNEGSRNAIEQVPHAQALAESDPARALDVFERAAAASLGGLMVEEAVVCQEQAVAASTRVHGATASSTLRTRLVLGEMLRIRGDERSTSELWSVVDEATAAGDVTTATEALGVMCRLGPTTESGMLDERLASLAEEVMPRCPDLRVRAMALTQLSLLFSMADGSKSREYFDRSLADARATRDPEIIGYVLGDCYTAVTDPADLSLRHSYAHELLGIGERLESDKYRFDALHILFSSQLQYGDPLIRTTTIALSHFASVIGTPSVCWMADYLRASQLQLDNRLDECLDLAARGRDRATTAKSRARATYFAQELAVRFAEGRGGEYLEMIQDIAVAQPRLRAWLCLLAWSAANRSDWAEVERAADALDNGAALTRDLAWSGSMLCLARAIAARGDRDRADVILPILRPFDEHMSWAGVCTFGPIGLGVAELSLCVDDLDGAQRALESARSVTNRLHTPLYDADLDACEQRLMAAVDAETEAEP